MHEMRDEMSGIGLEQAECGFVRSVCSPGTRCGDRFWGPLRGRESTNVCHKRASAMGHLPWLGLPSDDDVALSKIAVGRVLGPSGFRRRSIPSRRARPPPRVRGGAEARG